MNKYYTSNSLTINETGRSHLEDSSHKAQDFKGSCDTLSSLDSNYVNNRYNAFLVNKQIILTLIKVLQFISCTTKNVSINIIFQ